MGSVSANSKAKVIARSGLRLRSGPGSDFDVISVLAEGAIVNVLQNTNGWTLVDLQNDGIADGFVYNLYLSDLADRPPSLPYASGTVSELIKQGSTPQDLKRAGETAAAKLPEYPHNGCAAHLSALLQQAGFGNPMIFGAGKLAHYLAENGWHKIPVGAQQPGDIGVCFDNTSPPGADHIYLVVKVIDGDEMMIADNQRTEDATHPRYASGKGRTPTEYFLRA